MSRDDPENEIGTPDSEPELSSHRSRKACCHDGTFGRDDGGPHLCGNYAPVSRLRGMPLRCRRTARAPICIILSLLCLPSCAEPQPRPAGVISTPSPSGAGSAGATAREARKQNWGCDKINREIAALIPTLEAEKERAEKEEEKMAATLERMFARLSGPPGAGNAALAEFRETRRDTDQLNDLLREKDARGMLSASTIPLS